MEINIHYNFSTVNVSFVVLACLDDFLNSVVWVKKTDSTHLSLFDLRLSQYLAKKVIIYYVAKNLSSGRFWGGRLFGFGFFFAPGNTE